MDLLGYPIGIGSLLIPSRGTKMWYQAAPLRGGDQLVIIGELLIVRWWGFDVGESLKCWRGLEEMVRV